MYAEEITGMSLLDKISICFFINCR